MKPSACPPLRSSVVFLAASLCLLLVYTGCGHANKRPASSLSVANRAALDRYEQIRAALADDNLHDAKVAASDLAAALKPAASGDQDAATLAAAEAVANSPALDRTRQAFKTLSAKIMPLAQGVEGYYVMTCPLPSAGDWVQQKPDADNPYFGKAMRQYGEIKK